MQKVGTVERIMRYPVKGMGGESLDSVDVKHHGLDGDRVFHFARVDSQEKPSRAAVNIRDFTKLLLYKAKLVGSEVAVTGPDGHDVDLRSEALLSEMQKRAASSPRGLSGKVELREKRTGFPDSSAVSIIGVQSIAEISTRFGSTVNPLRFRENFYINWENGKPFYENELVGKELKIGEVVIRITKKDHRCVVITVNPETGEADAGTLLKLIPLDSADGSNKPSIGVYAEVVKEGTAKVGDGVFL